MKIKVHLNYIVKHPLGVLYGVLLGFVAFSAAVPMCFSEQYDAALADLALAVIFIWFLLKSCVSAGSRPVGTWEKFIAWGVLAVADICVLFPASEFLPYEKPRFLPRPKPRSPRYLSQAQTA